MNSFERELNSLKLKIIDMATILKDTLNLVISDITKKQSTASIDSSVEAIYKMELDIEKTCNEILALRHPTAGDLRFVVATSRISTEFEDIARHTANLNKYYSKIVKYESPESLLETDFSELKSMLSLTNQMLGNAIKGFETNDINISLENINLSSELDTQYKNSTRIIVSQILENPNFVRKYLNTFWILYSLDRICEYARNISLHLIFIIKGNDVRHMSSKKILKLVQDEVNQ